MNDIIVTLHCVSVELGRFNCLVLVMGLLKIFQQNLHIYHRNDSTSLCNINFMYILVLEDVIGSDVGDGFYWPTLYIAPSAMYSSSFSCSEFL